MPLISFMQENILDQGTQLLCSNIYHCFTSYCHLVIAYHQDILAPSWVVRDSSVERHWGLPDDLDKISLQITTDKYFHLIFLPLVLLSVFPFSFIFYLDQHHHGLTVSLALLPLLHFPSHFLPVVFSKGPIH